MKDISKEEMQRVLSEVGKCTIKNAVEEEGMFVSSTANMTINWHAAEVWVKRRAPDFGVSEDSLLVIVINYLKEHAKTELEKYV